MITKFKKITLTIGIIVAIILIAFLLINKFGFFKAELKQEWKSCGGDSDCTLVKPPGCCVCGRDAINSKFTNEYEKYRRWNTGSCWNVACVQCPPFSAFKVPRCVNNICTATDKCTNDSDCSSVDCSRLNVGVKSGYLPYCVENKCKCMCYRCE